jgi:calcineurin-like phosphoesterase family protein
MQAVWFTSDTHLGHANVIEHCQRPFASLAEMDDAILGNINALVMPQDILYHLGDFAWKNPKEYRSRIKCRQVHLVIGNHDRKVAESVGFASVSGYKELKVGEGRQRIVLCHYAMRVWNQHHRGAWHLYGHSHGSLPDEGRRAFDVGVDCWAYKPLSLEQVSAEMSQRSVVPIDHHAPA